MNSNYIKLCRILKERGIVAEDELCKTYENIIYYEIIDILRKDTAFELWGDKFLCEKHLVEIDSIAEDECTETNAISVWQYRTDQIMDLWHSEDSKPLEDCPKVISYLLENIKP